MSQITFLTPRTGPGSGTVTSISQGTGITCTPNPITTVGTVALTVPVAIANGGTNATSMTTTYGVNYFDGTSIVTTAVGSAGQVLTSNGVGVAPTFQAAGGGNPAASCNFFAYLSVNQLYLATSDNTVAFDTELFDVGNNYDLVTNRFTAPNTGYYSFTFMVTVAGGAPIVTGDLFYLLKNPTTVPAGLTAYDVINSQSGYCFTGVFPLNAGDIVEPHYVCNNAGLFTTLYAQDYTAWIFPSYGTYFSGYQLS